MNHFDTNLKEGLLKKANDATRPLTCNLGSEIDSEALIVLCTTIACVYRTLAAVVVDFEYYEPREVKEFSMENDSENPELTEIDCRNTSAGLLNADLNSIQEEVREIAKFDEVVDSQKRGKYGVENIALMSLIYQLVDGCLFLEIKPQYVDMATN